jgi:hypothetical protein
MCHVIDKIDNEHLTMIMLSKPYYQVSFIGIDEIAYAREIRLHVVLDDNSVVFCKLDSATPCYFVSGKLLIDFEKHTVLIHHDNNLCGVKLRIERFFSRYG